MAMGLTVRPRSRKTGLTVTGPGHGKRQWIPKDWTGSRKKRTSGPVLILRKLPYFFLLSSLGAITKTKEKKMAPRVREGRNILWSEKIIPGPMT